MKIAIVALFLLAACATPEPVVEPPDADAIVISGPEHERLILELSNLYQQVIELRKERDKFYTSTGCT